MKTKIAILLAGLITFMSMTSLAHAGRGGFVQYSYGPHVTQIAELPAQVSSEIGLNGYNIGWRHEKVELFWMPIWGSTEGQYVLYTEAGDGWRSIPIPAEMLDPIASELNLDLSDPSPISNFSIMWGWLVYGPLAFLALIGLAKGKREQDQNASQIGGQAYQAVDAEIARKVMAQNPAPSLNRSYTTEGPVTFGKRR